MPSTLQNTFKAFIQEIFDLPLWIKQIIYMELKEQFESSAVNCCLDASRKSDCLQLFIPKLTYSGKKELEKKTKSFNENMYLFLEGVFQNTSIVEICIKNNWNLSECSKYFLEAINASLVIPPSSPFIKGTALYLSGQIRLGEYFVKINKITIEQLDEALRKQKMLEEAFGDRPGLAEILVDLKFLTKNDTEAILLIKEDCKKYYKSNLSTKAEES